MTLPLLAASAAVALLAGACSASANLPLVGNVAVDSNAPRAAPATPTPRPPTPSPNTTSPTSLASLQQQYVSVVKQVSPSVVQIETGDGSLGSGIVFDKKGDIVTNAHVVNSQRLSPIGPTPRSGRSTTSLVVTTADGTHYGAAVVGVATGNDLAVIRVGGAHLKPAQFADSSRLNVGDIVLAIGSPLGLQSSVTDGIVSAVNREVPESRSVDLKGLIQTSAAINPGNSGGALVDLESNVIGIPTLGANSDTGGAAAGIGFAIPSNQVVSVTKQLTG